MEDVHGQDNKKKAKKDEESLPTNRAKNKGVEFRSLKLSEV